MIIILLIILFMVVAIAAVYTYQEYKEVKNLEELNKTNEEIIVGYKLAIKTINEMCDEGLKATALIKTRYAVKDIKEFIKNIE